MSPPTTLRRVALVYVTCSHRCSVDLVLPGGRPLQPDDSGMRMVAEFEQPTGDVGALRRWAVDASSKAEIVAVYLIDRHEDRHASSWREGYERYQRGARDEADSYDTATDEDWPAIRGGDDERRKRYLWERWPLSRVARQLGYDSRLHLVFATLVEFLGGREAPSDIDMSDVQTRPVFLQRQLIERLDAAAARRGVSPDRLLAELIAKLSPKELLALAEAPRIPSGTQIPADGGTPTSDMRSRDLMLPAALVAKLVEPAVAADRSVSHVVQQVIAQQLP